MGGAITLPWQDDNVAEAAEAEDLQQLRWLLDNHGDPNALSRSSGRTALGCVAAGGRSDVVKLLLAARAEVNLCDAGGHCEAGSGSALHHSSSNGWEETSGLLLSHGADPDIYDEMGSTALHIAAVEGRSEVVSVLIDSRANLETKESELASGWRRALHLAVIAGRVEAAKCLLDAKAIVNVAPSSPRSRVTPMHLAAFNGRECLSLGFRPVEQRF
ncbi:unnamed protein product [Polarella glacialis]|uniref:Uncharacterized protein n=1 Tax=Polarella glacialis TaxID=89957 RepID=A0A813J873_POLGL|nr:unnamed protein product [Polarella glacialis]